MSDSGIWEIPEEAFQYSYDNENPLTVVEKIESMIKMDGNYTEFIESGKDSNEFDYKMSAGDAVIFDEGGVHKGSKTLYSERMVLRYLYSIKKN